MVNSMSMRRIGSRNRRGLTFNLSRPLRRRRLRRLVHPSTASLREHTLDLLCVLNAAVRSHHRLDRFDPEAFDDRLWGQKRIAEMDRRVQQPIIMAALDRIYGLIPGDVPKMKS